MMNRIKQGNGRKKYNCMRSEEEDERNALEYYEIQGKRRKQTRKIEQN